MGVSSRKLGEMGKESPMFINALINIADQKLLPVPGEVLVRDENSFVVGSVGVSSDLSDEDEHCAITGNLA